MSQMPNPPTSAAPLEISIPLSQESTSPILTITRDPETQSISISISHSTTPPTRFTLDPITRTAHLTHTGSLTQTVEGDYTLIVTGTHTTFIRRNALIRVLGDFVVFTSRTIQHNPIVGRFTRFIMSLESRFAHLLPFALDTSAAIARKTQSSHDHDSRKPL